MSDTVIIALIVIVLILVSNVVVYKFARTPDTKAIEQAVKKERERLEKDWQSHISGKEKLLLQKSEELLKQKRKYNDLKEEIKERAAEASSIKPPETNKELRERFTGLGYPPK